MNYSKLRPKPSEILKRVKREMFRPTIWSKIKTKLGYPPDIYGISLYICYAVENDSKSSPVLQKRVGDSWEFLQARISNLVGRGRYLVDRWMEEIGLSDPLLCNKIWHDDIMRKERAQRPEYIKYRDNFIDQLITDLEQEDL